MSPRTTFGKNRRIHGLFRCCQRKIATTRSACVVIVSARSRIYKAFNAKAVTGGKYYSIPEVMVDKMLARAAGLIVIEGGEGLRGLPCRSLAKAA